MKTKEREMEALEVCQGCTGCCECDMLVPEQFDLKNVHGI